MFKKRLGNSHHSLASNPAAAHQAVLEDREAGKAFLASALHTETGVDGKQHVDLNSSISALEAALSDVENVEQYYTMPTDQLRFGDFGKNFRDFGTISIQKFAKDLLPRKKHVAEL